ncbi:hypothetical protein BDV32DRAFT_1443 [Aspergillus pseudonomiae]|uniref:Rhodopsin domain-containing protein n=1 Tax=Aspergillus pseudonomiae TaxID=1506151 RepID=A0A5N7DRT9_9EURO|nr:uncharacterized protein BDV37DRAFT_268173 [Aspergillus pseudonomiae]KAB8266138.1 hypothetical protein BDV32DRAFT_1443 [Aspergillus pseudonomiae]KAE8409005.1 hypothetical protein BDV37DRAFT_268173 [Aspergillus pseudonomiae]
MGRFLHDPDRRAPILNVVNWFLLVVAVLSVLTRLGTKLWMFHRFTSDDYLIIVSLLFAMGGSISMSIAVHNGYGDHVGDIDGLHWEAIQKAQYAGFLVFTLSLYFSKLSLSVFIRNLTPVSRDHFHATIMQVLLTVWAVVALFGNAFQCQASRPWDTSGSCIDLNAWQYYFCASNIVTDIFIIVQALVLISRIQASVKKKIVFATIFLSRILVILPSIAQLVLIHDVANSPDRSFDDYGVAIAVETVQCASIVTACWGQLKPFLNQLKSNGLRIQGVEYQHTSAKASNPRSEGQDDQSRHTDPTHSHSHSHHELVPIGSGQGNMTTISASRAWDADSQSSQAGMIRETRTWNVSAARRSERSDSL